MGALDQVGPPKALGLGVLLSALNPKNLLLSVAAAGTVAGGGLSAGEEAVAYAVFAVIGTVGVGVPVVLAIALGDRSQHILEGLRGWMARNNAVIMAVLCLVIGAKLIGDGISGLA
jgi:threonine/homoserine/homoserine lactone efflux protein